MAILDAGSIVEPTALPVAVPLTPGKLVAPPPIELVDFCVDVDPLAAGAPILLPTRVLRLLSSEPTSFNRVTVVTWRQNITWEMLND